MPTTLNSQLSAEAVDSVLKHFGLLAQVVKEYGCHLFGEGKSLFCFRHLVVYTQQSFVGAKPYLQCCWDLVSKWEICEPPTHRVPIPEPVAKAIMACAILWGWRRFASSSLGSQSLRLHQRHIIKITCPSHWRPSGAWVGGFSNSAFSCKSNVGGTSTSRIHRLKAAPLT